MGASTTITSQINVFQTLLSAVISAIVVIVGLLIKEYFDNNRSRRNYIIHNSYKIHERLRDNLRGFLRSESYAHLNLPHNVSKKDRVGISYRDFEIESKKDIFSNLNEVTVYAEEFEFFEKTLLQDIVKVSKLSVSKVQRIATKIEDLYDQTKSEEVLMDEVVQDEFYWKIKDSDRDLTAMEVSYMKYIKEAHKKVFWIKIQTLLLTLEKEIECVVKLRL